MDGALEHIKGEKTGSETCGNWKREAKINTRKIK